MPSGLLPAMQLNGRLIIESDAIMAALEREFPDFKPLLPQAGSAAAGRVKPLLRLERRLFGDWLRWLTSAWWGFCWIRLKISGSPSPELRQAAIRISVGSAA